MPHTSHRSKQLRGNKRKEVMDENGWTRVTNVDPTRRAPKPLSVHCALVEREDGCIDSYSSSRPYEGATAEKVLRSYEDIEKRWMTSESWKKLEEVIREKVERHTVEGVDRCVVFGTGSFCGEVSGWVERFEVSLWQIAAFKKVVELIAEITGRRPVAVAQDPVYNDVDAEFLKILGIEKMNSPQGFKTLTTSSLIYAPAAELHVELLALAPNPAISIVSSKLDFFWRNDKGEACTNRILVHEKDGALDEDESGVLLQIHELHADDPRKAKTRDEIEEGLLVVEEFQKDKQCFRIPDLEVKDHPFFGVHVYARSHSVEL